MKKVLILGAGLVVKPIVTYLLKQGFRVTVASPTPDRAAAMIQGHPNGEVIDWVMDQEDKLDEMVMDHDLTVSFLPYLFHLQVAMKCLKHKKDMVTASYIKPEMQVLHEEAKTAGIIILNELGLDPGIDHMSAMRIIDNIHAKGGKVEEFFSICGALPAPEAATNPFRYKFTWSPKGVIMAGNNEARFLHNGKTVMIPTENLFKNPFKVNFDSIGELDVYPNRDSISYSEIYGIPEAKTMFRGTFRYSGWCETMDVMKQIGLTSYEKFHLEGMTYADLMALMIGSMTIDNIKEQVATHLGLEPEAHSIKAMDWLGLFEDQKMNRTIDSPFEVISDLMIEKMGLGDTERDMVVLQHTFLASYPDSAFEVIRSRMLDFGTPATDTSIARTVSLPAAIGVEMILNDQIKAKGVFRPTLPEIYLPILDKLEELGIKMVEEYDLPLTENIHF
jgi:saccharopine dehydrogenase-like NADP-dependent oxidoreductase